MSEIDYPHKTSFFIQSLYRLDKRLLTHLPGCGEEDRQTYSTIQGLYSKTKPSEVLRGILSNKTVEWMSVHSRSIIGALPLGKLFGDRLRSWFSHN